MSVYFLETGRILGLDMSINLALQGASVCKTAWKPKKRAIASAIAFAAMLLVSTLDTAARSEAELAAFEQTMNRVTNKTCRLNVKCSPSQISADAPKTVGATAEQIVNRIDQSVAAADTEAAPLVIDAEPASPKADAKVKHSSKIAEQTMNREQPKDIYGEGSPFSISVDGETVVSSTTVDKARKDDVGLAGADIQVKFDGLDTTPVLNASHSVDDSGDVHFFGHLNYPDFISKSEYRIYRVEDGKIGDLVGTVAADEKLSAHWQKAQQAPGDEYSYVLRVYDEKGRFDETVLIPLHDTTASVGDGIISGENADRDRSGLRNIPVHGGSVTVFGRNVPEGHTVKVLGEEIRVDSNNSFVTQKILPPGDHDVDVAIYGIKDDGLTFSRQVNIPDNDWFYVGLADLTVGHKFQGLIEDVNTGEFKSTYAKGRLAFYLKGKIKGKYLLTAAADTGEGDIKDLFTGWDKKDPRHILKGLDPDDYYPVYGDDSSLVEDAPTKGKFYVRLERGKSNVMWGNFKTKITGTKFAAAERALYGAASHYQSESVTSFGEARTNVDLYAAQPGTVPQRDNFRGTGGSAYFLKRQQITSGSEQLTVEVRDPLTGRVLSSRTLKIGEDYEIDYVQGVVILKSPLPSSVSTGSAVSSGTLGNNTQHLVVNYEYSPALGADSGQVYGGRASQWLGDHIEVGVTASKDSSYTANNELLEADLRLRMSDNTYFEAEIAQSRGQGLGQSFSADGGLTFRDELAAGSTGKAALAYRLKARADLGELSNKRINGYGEVFYEQREAGFSALDTETALAKRIFGGSVHLDLSENLSVHLALNAIEEDLAAPLADRKLYEAVAEANVGITENLSLLAGVNWSDYRDPTPGAIGKNGSRTDVGARLTYQVSEKTKVFVFGQTTAQLKGDRLRNDRIGVGAETKLTERLSLSGDVSTGTSGIGATALVTYESSADNRTYIGYKLDPERDNTTTGGTVLHGSDKGVIVAGTHRKLNEWLSAFSETNADFFGYKRSLTQVYGITFKPDEVWSASLGMELGAISDPYALSNRSFDRKGFSLQAGYMTEKISASAKIEARFENSNDNTLDRNTYLMRAQTSWKTNENWRLSAHLDALISNSSSSTILDGDYIEGSIGYAYRPVTNDKLNVLFKYAFLYDLPGPDQLSSNGLRGPLQRSQILSVDASYDINEYITIGAKYGFRFGDVSTTRLSSDFERSTAHLGIIRVDVSVVKNWDAILEGRVLYAPEQSQTYYGALAAVYRHVGNNAKVGVGYNFGKFSDDLTDLIHDDQGVFLNVIGKF